MSNIYYIIKSSIVSQPNQTNFVRKWFVNKTCQWTLKNMKSIKKQNKLVKGHAEESERWPSG